MHPVIIWEAGVGSSCRVLCDSCHQGNLNSGLGFAICTLQQLAFAPWFPLKCPSPAVLYILQPVFFPCFLCYKSAIWNPPRVWLSCCLWGCVQEMEEKKWLFCNSELSPGGSGQIQNSYIRCPFTKAFYGHLFTKGKILSIFIVLFDLLLLIYCYCYWFFLSELHENWKKKESSNEAWRNTGNECCWKFYLHQLTQCTGGQCQFPHFLCPFQHLLASSKSLDHTLWKATTYIKQIPYLIQCICE